MIRILDPDPEPILAYVREYFSYSEELKGLIYKKATAARNRNRIGQRAGSVHPQGYVAIKIRGRLFREHRLVFLLHKGRWPEGELDHDNRDASDNRIDNLRESSRSGNCANRQRWGMTSKYRGVHFHRKCQKYQSAIRVHGRTKYLGVYADPEEAAKAYDKAAVAAFGEFASLNFPENQ